MRLDTCPDKADKPECIMPKISTMYRPSLSDLEAVLAISRRASFRQAALDLGLSPTALSSAIGKLEAQLGVRLFNRTTRSVALSDAGRAFVDAIGPALDDISAAMQAARASQETPSGTLRINAFPEAADTIAPLVLTFLRRYPDVHVDLVTEGRLVDIVADGFDLGLRAQNLVPSDMIAVPLGPPRRHAVVGAPAYFERHPMPRTPPDLLAHRCIRIRLPNGALFRWPFEKSGETHLLDVTGPFTLDEFHLARTAVLDGIGLGLFLEPTIAPDLAAGTLLPVLTDWTPQLPPLCLYYPHRRHASAALRAFVGMAREGHSA